MCVKCYFVEPVCRAGILSLFVYSHICLTTNMLHGAVPFDDPPFCSPFCNPRDLRFILYIDISIQLIVVVQYVLVCKIHVFSNSYCNYGAYVKVILIV